MGALVRELGWWGQAGASLGVPFGAVVNGRDRKMGEGLETWVRVSLDGEAKAKALLPAASLGPLGSRSWVPEQGDRI